MRLRILSTAVLRALDMEIDQYKKYKEEVLLRGLTYSSALSDAQKMHKSISDQPLGSYAEDF